MTQNKKYMLMGKKESKCHRRWKKVNTGEGYMGDDSTIIAWNNRCEIFSK